MTTKHSPVTVRQLLSTISTKLKADKPFQLTLVQKRPRSKVNSKVIKLTCYDFCEAFDPQLEYNRILNCLELPYKSIENVTAKTKGDLAPHTLHLLIPLSELETVTDYPKLLASIGYSSVIDTEKIHLFINKRKPMTEMTEMTESKVESNAVKLNTSLEAGLNAEPKINIIEVSTEEEAHEAMLLQNLDRRHPGMQSFNQDLSLDFLKKNSKTYLN